jgi:hypothetical protein
MDDVTLPQDHGYPIRAVIPGLYGMMSAKWIDTIQVVDSTYEGYWQLRGYSIDGTVQTQAFISIPSDGGPVSLAEYPNVMIGGMAYAGNRGISKVEVSTDQGNTWQTAQLKTPISNDSWTLWACEWTPQSTGEYAVYARATDGTGTTQTSVASDSYPNGATGYAMVSFNVTS